MTAAILSDAATTVTDRGWCQHVSFDMDTGAVCARGALMLAAFRVVRAHGGDGLAALQAAEWALSDHLAATVGERSVIGWNDAEGQTVDQVLAVLREAAAALDVAGAGEGEAPAPVAPS